MQTLKRRPNVRRGGIINLPVDALEPNPVQPRKNFEDESLRELCSSIEEFGILNPLTVRLRSGRYELVAGERRLRAAKMAGLEDVPCILLDVGLEEASLIALIENLQRKDLDFIEEANGINQLIRMFGLSQEEIARRIGKSQSAVANKLRLLKLPRDVLETLRDRGLTERHGRALLRLPDADSQRAALMHIIDMGLTVALTDSYIDAILASQSESTAEADTEAEEEKQLPRRAFIMKDVRVFMNTLMHGLDLMKQGGIMAGMKKQETEEALILTISIPKSKTEE
ncbi:MAG: ParB/RepB/Spo0J family partition protein [Bacillota bacterium]|nr:ParB/RepB/Spo0J family partition protein [Bacillota bacterium]